MHSFRLRYIILGLLIYIRSAFCRTTCLNAEFTDVASRAYVANIVFEGTVDGKLATVDGKVESDFIPGVNYNASFTVNKLLKGYLQERGKNYLPVIVGDFGPEDLEKCIAPLIVGEKYVVFIHEALDPSVPFHRIAAVPELSSKKALRDVRKQTCRKCAKHPSAKLVPKDPEITVGRRLQLRCKTRGKPTPLVTWYKNEVLLQSSEHVLIENGKRSSRLRIRNAQKEDSGIYSCKVKSVVGESRSDTMVAIIKVREPSPTLTPGSKLVRCEQQSYCLNGGICYELPDLGSRFCRCTHEYDGRRCLEHRQDFTTLMSADAKTITDLLAANYMQRLCRAQWARQWWIAGAARCSEKYGGNRCQSKDVFSVLKELESREAHQFDRSMTITGLIIGALVFLAILLASYCLARRRRIKFERKKREKQRAAQKALPVNGLCRPLLDGAGEQNNQPITRTSMLAQANLLAPPPPPPPMVERQDSSTQTRESCLSSSGRSRHKPSSRDLPRQNTAPLPQSYSSRSLPPQNGLLSTAALSTPAMHEPPPAPPPTACSSPPPPPLPSSMHYTTTVALVESDPEKNSRQSSPSQTSKTESAHGEAATPNNNVRSGSISGGNGGAMDMMEQHSDYDNQHGAEQSDSEESSSTGEEQALFLKMQQQPPPPRPTSRSSRSSSFSWDEFGNAPPTYASDHFAFNPYAIDNDIIDNNHHHHQHHHQQQHPHPNHHHHHPPPHHNHHPHHPHPMRGGGRGPNYEAAVIDGIMYDPDPDATPV